MGEQSTSGRVFLVDGTGAWGNATPGNVAYGATKRALTQLRVRSDFLQPACSLLSIACWKALFHIY